MKKIGSIIIIVLIIGFIVAGFNYINYRNKNGISDAAFVKSDKLIYLSFKVGGKIIYLDKQEGQTVKKGDILAKIDTTDFIVEKKKIENEIASLKAKKESLIIEQNKTKQTIKVKLDILNNKKAKLTPNIDSLQFTIDALEVKLAKLTKDKERFTTLYNQQLIQKEKLEAINTNQKELENKISSYKSKLLALKLDYKDIQYNIKLTNIQNQSINQLEKNILSLENKIKSLKNTQEGIENKIAYATLYSPINGIIAKKFINTDSIVKKGSLIYSVVDPKDIHLEVLLSEKKLFGIKVGNSVKIDIDAIKDKSFKGKVQSILPTSASTFSLVPRDIASGEFTKLDQRFIIRIDILNPTPNIRIGMGATVAIKRD